MSKVSDPTAIPRSLERGHVNALILCILFLSFSKNYTLEIVIDNSARMAIHLAPQKEDTDTTPYGVVKN